MKSAVLWPTSLSCLLQASKPPVTPAAALPLGDPESLKGEGAKKEEMKPPSSSTTWAPYIKGWAETSSAARQTGWKVQRFNPHVDGGSREGDRWLQGRTCGCKIICACTETDQNQKGYVCDLVQLLDTVGESCPSRCFIFFTKPTTQLCVRVRVRARRGTLIRLLRLRKSHRHNTTTQSDGCCRGKQ